MEIDMNVYARKTLHQALAECAPNVSTMGELAKESVKPLNVALMSQRVQTRMCYLEEDVLHNVPKLYALHELVAKYKTFRLGKLKKIYVFIERIE